MWREAGGLSPWRKPPQLSSLDQGMATRVERLDREVSRLTGVIKGGEEGDLLSFAGCSPTRR